MKQFPRLNWARQLAVIALISCTSVAVHGQGATALGAVSLQPFSVTEPAGMPLSMGIQIPLLGPELPSTSNEPVSYFPGHSSSLNLEAAIRPLDAPEYLDVDEMAPVPETSTWVAALLAALVTLRLLYKRFGGRFSRHSTAGSR